jgi:hypothetical protein
MKFAYDDETVAYPSVIEAAPQIKATALLMAPRKSRKAFIPGVSGCGMLALSGRNPRRGLCILWPRKKKYSHAFFIARLVRGYSHANL